jgi:D-alanine--poly(phosphoribitol) ligase subunit 1
MAQSCIFYLEKTASMFPEKIAVVDRDKSYTFKELTDRAKVLALSIPSGIRNQPIAVYLEKSVDCIVAFAAVLYSGNFYVPLDSSSPLERLKKVMNNLSPFLTITANKHVDFLTASCGAVPTLLMEDLSASQLLDVDQERHIIERAESVIDTDPIYCLFTSGSTGEPKGVLIPHRAVRDCSDWLEECFEVSGEEVIGNQAPFHFDASVPDIYLMMKTGATLHIIPEEHYRFVPLLIDYLDNNSVTLIFWVPSVLVRIANLGLLEGRTLPALKRVLFCGEVMPSKFLNYWIKQLPHTQFSNLYGPTETTYACTYFIVDRPFKDDEVLPLGRPCANTEVFVLDTQNRLVEGDEIGELCVRGSALALGYWNDTEKTRLAFPQSPLNRNFVERIYRTGDLAKYNHKGELEFCGRQDSQIKLSGFRIELGEIQSAVTSLPEISDSSVLFNKSGGEITLFYVSNNLDAGPEGIRQKLLGLLPKYMVPVKYYRISEMPHTSTGKVDRLRLSREYLEG